MKTIRCIFFFCSFFIVSFVTSQQLSPFVVSSSGGFYSNAEGMLSFTTGELAAIETYTHPLVTLTQGFQQPWDLNTHVDDNQSSGFSFDIYPNPSDGIVHLITKSQA